MKIRIKRIKNVPVPRYMSKGASGFDLYAALDSPVYIKPKEIALIPTGLIFDIPSGFEIQVRPRSGLALKGLTVLNSPGTIDSDYRGEVKVILANLSNETFVIEPMMRIAQAVVSKVYKVEFVEKDIELTERGEKGFGSTGLGQEDIK